MMPRPGRQKTGMRYGKHRSCAPCQASGRLRRAYNATLIDQASDAAMEAEQLNSIENRIDDIAGRAGELRRYL